MSATARSAAPDGSDSQSAAVDSSAALDGSDSQSAAAQSAAPDGSDSQSAARSAALDGSDSQSAARSAAAPSRAFAEYHAWLVDLDGTLYDARWVKLLMGCELLTLGFSALPVIRAFRNQHESLRDLASLNGSSPFEHQLNCTATALGRSPAEVQRLVMLWMFDKPCKWIRLFRRRPLLNEIESYRTQGGKTALVSDYPATTKLAALGAQDLFDTVVASGEPNGPPRLKPDPAGYLAAAQRLGIPPEHCLVIGDRPDADGAAAQAAGMAFRRIV